VEQRIVTALAGHADGERRAAIRITGRDGEHAGVVERVVAFVALQTHARRDRTLAVIAGCLDAGSALRIERAADRSAVVDRDDTAVLDQIIARAARDPNPSRRGRGSSQPRRQPSRSRRLHNCVDETLWVLKAVFAASLNAAKVALRKSILRALYAAAVGHSTLDRCSGRIRTATP
jgi:hypothetical protein